MRIRTFRGHIGFKSLHNAVMIAAGMVLAWDASAQITSGDFASQPPVITDAEPPLVMLTMSNDHQMFYKAYTDWTDLDGDGRLDITYEDNFDYYGYFETNLCYTYTQSGTDRFIPAGTAGGANGHDCSGVSNAWSGNLLNWLTMTRADVLRKVLYGGKRHTDTAGQTILERAYLPNDNHAWSKYLSAAQLDAFTPYSPATYSNGITFCNLTPPDGSTLSQDNDNAPRLRVAEGQYGDWAAHESQQCMWQEEYDPPGNDNPYRGNANNHEFDVRVEVCESTYGGSRCREYNSGNSVKPTGLLQQYGGSGDIAFGLMTGSYNRNKSGGMLRKNVSNISDEIDNNGRFVGSGGIIDSLDTMRIVDFQYGGTGYGGVDNCPYGQNTWSNGDCVNWGNPMGEIYLEAIRYFAGASPTAAFGSNDSAYGLSSESWVDPFGPAQGSPTGGGYEYCSKPNVITISTGVFGFDDDEYGSASDIPGSLNVDDETDEVGSLEGIHGNDYYVGSTTGGSPDDVCSSETVNALSAVTGLCPEAAGLQGSYTMAGLAYYAHKSTSDISATAPENQTVDTYSVSLAPPIPEIRVPVDGSEVTIIPTGYNFRDNNAMVLVNFQVIQQDADSGLFLYNFENAPAGADHDSDFKGFLRYWVDGDEIAVAAHNTGSSAGSTMHVGYTIDGVSDAGTHYLVSNHDVGDLSDQGGGHYNITEADIDSNCTSNWTAVGNWPDAGDGEFCELNYSGADRTLRGIRTHQAGTPSTDLLKNPLWYAAKYGSFNDRNGNDEPDLQSEWDSQINETGNPGSDGVPDNYFLVYDPSTFEDRLARVLNRIMERVSSGTAAAVVANSGSGAGALYQALYQPITQAGTNEVLWTGFLHGWFIDEYGRLREDGNGNGELDDYSTDQAIALVYDQVDQELQVQRYTSTDGGETVSPDGAPVPLNQTQPLWRAHDQLAALNNGTIQSNRNYATEADQGRYILTSLTGSTTIPFESDQFASTGEYSLLQATDDTHAANIVNFIRGDSTTPYRNRFVDYDNDSVVEYLRLGDIVHSSPQVVGSPRQGYDTRYGDDTYAQFRDQYQDRRQMIYVGANDGMLHAFNGGFWDSGDRAFRLNDGDPDNGTETEHPLGSELWGYVPTNLLPHLKWLTETDYPHVYYMDGEPRAFDVNMFPDSAKHPNGWGTILVAGMRLGGGNIDIDTDGDGSTDFSSGSAYVVLDITDPEEPPELIGEFTLPNGEYTTSAPALVVDRAPGPGSDWSNPATNSWQLVIGSGPTDLATVTSNQTGKLYFYNLNNGAVSHSNTVDVTAGNASAPSAFVADPTSVDWDNNFSDDAIYFGTANDATTGSLYKYPLSASAPGPRPSLLLSPNRPFNSAPLVRRDTQTGDKWVEAGTGRMYVQSDKQNAESQGFYAVKDNATASTAATQASLTDMQNVTGIQVFENGELRDNGSGDLPASCASGTCYYRDMDEHILANRRGWYKEFDDGSNPSERSLNAALQISDVTVFNTYTPSVDACEAEGYTRLYAVNFRTGLPEPYGPLGTDPNVTITDSDGDTQELVKESGDETPGLGSDPTPHSSQSGTQVLTNYSTGEVSGQAINPAPVSSGRLSWEELEPQAQ